MAQLTIEFTRDTLSDSFYLGVDVLSGVDVDPICIVVRTGRSNVIEHIARIATLNDFVGIREAPVVDGYNHLACRDFDPIVPAPGDKIQLNDVPSLWEFFGYTPGTFHEVDSYDSAYKAAKMVVGDEFPAYGGRLSFSLYDSSLLLKGTFGGAGAATLDLYNSLWDDEIYYRMQTNHSSIEQLENAINKFVSLQTEAQSLVDNTETYLDEYAGTSTEIYT